MGFNIMKKLIWLLEMLVLITLLYACGLKGPLYFPVKVNVEQKNSSLISIKEIEDQSIETDMLYKLSNKNN